MKKLLPRQYAQVLYGLTKDLDKKEYDGAIKSFIDLLHKHQMTSHVEGIIKEFINLIKEKDGIKQLKITSAHELSETVLKNIKKHFGDMVEVETAVDESLIGGVKVQDGYTIFDGTAKAQLEKLKAYIK